DRRLTRGGGAHQGGAPPPRPRPLPTPGDTMTVPSTLGTGRLSPVVGAAGPRAATDPAGERPAPPAASPPATGTAVGERDGVGRDAVRAGAGTRPGRARRAALAAVVPLGLLGLWQLLTAVTGTFAPYELPAPGAVWGAAVELA